MHCALLLAIDLLLLIAVNGIALFLSVASRPEAFAETLMYCGVTVATAIPILLVAGLNRTVWRFTTLHDCSRVVVAVLMTMALTAAIHKPTLVLPWHTPVSDCAPIPCHDGSADRNPRTSALAAYQAQSAPRQPHRIRARRYPRSSASTRSPDSSALRDGKRRQQHRRGRYLSENRRHQGRILGSHAVLGRPDDIVKIVHELEVHGVQVNRVILAQSFESEPERARRNPEGQERAQHPG